MPHGIKNLRVAGNWADGKELQYFALQTSDHDQTDKDWQAGSNANRRIQKDEPNTAQTQISFA